MIDVTKALSEAKYQEKKFVGKKVKKIFWYEFLKQANQLVKLRDPRKEFIIQGNNEKILKTILRYFCNDKNFNEYDVIISDASLNKGLLVYGDYGVGKSLLFEAIHLAGKELFVKYNIKDFWFNTISAGSFTETYMKEVSKKEKNAETNFAIEDFYKGRLYIDDLGFEKKAFNKTELFAEILFERNRALKPTFITTNLTPTEIMERYGERIGDRIDEMCNVIKWSGDSLR